MTKTKYPDELNQYLQSTKVVDIDNPIVKQKVEELTKGASSETEIIKNIYHFVRDEIPYTFTYNMQKASEVLTQKKGQCNTKATLTIALLRAFGIPARYHCGSITKKMFKRIVPAWAYLLTPQEIPGHCWAEVFINEKWVAVENVIDLDLYQGIQRKIKKEGIKESAGCGISKDNFQKNWDGKTDVLMQQGALVEDKGTLANADEYLEKSQKFLNPIKEWFRSKLVKPSMNEKFAKLRKCQ